eukprot:g44375.t1
MQFLLCFIFCWSFHPVTSQATKNVLDIIHYDSRLRYLDAILVTLADPALATMLSQRPNVTIFAPTNAAFAEARIDSSNSATVNAILKYHILDRLLLSSDVDSNHLVPTLMTDVGYVNLGSDKAQVLRLTREDGEQTWRLNWNVPGEAASTSTVSEADVLALNGVIHIVDKVLQLPPRLSAAAAAAGTLSKLIAAWERTGLTYELEATPSLTIFAPVDGGLARLGIDLDDLSNEDLRRLLLNHVVAGRVVYSNNFLDGQTLTTMLGEAASIKVLEGTEITVTAASGASAVKKVSDVLMQNGVIHLIDGVLFPERFGPSQSIATNLQQNADLSTLASIVSNFADPAVEGLLQDVGRKLTLFAPTNAAFEAAGVDLSDSGAVNAILKYHMLGTQFLSENFGAYQLLPTLMTDAGYVNLGPGMPQVVRLTASVSMHPVQLNWNVPGEAASTSTVSEADVLALNGVIHIVDKVLHLPPRLSAAAAATGTLSKLIAAWERTGLTHELEATPSLTIFALVDGGLARLGIDLDDLSNEDLRRLLLNHVVAGRVVYSNNFLDGQTLTTMLGEAASIKVLEGTEITVTAASGASAVKKVADVLMQNGIIHLIDGVLFPERFGPGQSIATNLQQNADLSTLASIVSNFADPAVEGLLQDVGRKLTVSPERLFYVKPLLPLFISPMLCFITALLIVQPPGLAFCSFART